MVKLNYTWLLVLVMFSLVFGGVGISLGSQAEAADINLARGKNVIVSSTEASGNIAANAVDGNLSTRWASTNGDTQYYIVDLGTAQSVSSVILRWEAAYAKQFQIQTSTDNVNWTTVYSNYSNTGGTNTITFPSTTARYVKMYAFQRATTYGYSLYEFEIYGSGTQAATGVLDYIKSISGKQTVIGIHNR